MTLMNKLKIGGKNPTRKGLHIRASNYYVKRTIKDYG